MYSRVSDHYILLVKGHRTVLELTLVVLLSSVSQLKGTTGFLEELI